MCYSCYVGIQVSYHLNLGCFQLCKLNTVILSHRCHAGNSEWPSPPPCTCRVTVDTFGSCLVLCSLLWELIFSQVSAAKMLTFVSLRPSLLVPFSLLPIFVFAFSFSVEKLNEVCTLQQWEAADWLPFGLQNKPQGRAEHFQQTENKDICHWWEKEHSSVSWHQSMETVVPQSSAAPRWVYASAPPHVDSVHNHSKLFLDKSETGRRRLCAHHDSNSRDHMQDMTRP